MRLHLPLVACLALALASDVARAHSDYSAAWHDLYPGSRSDDNLIDGDGTNICQLCHASTRGGEPWNPYGWAILTQLGASLAERIQAVGPLDSDMDPGAFVNFGAGDGEIDNDAQPGWTNGPSNTIFFYGGTIRTDVMPPEGILGSLDPVPEPAAESLAMAALLAVGIACRMQRSRRVPTHRREAAPKGASRAVSP